MAKIGILIFLLPSLIWASSDCRGDIPNRIRHNGSPTSEYSESFLKAYDLLPEPLKQKMCKFHIFEVRKLDATAYSNMVYREGLLDKKIHVSHWASWKEQLNFKLLNNEEYKFYSDLPTVSVTINNQDPEFLFFVLIHELAHNIYRETEFKNEWNYLHNSENNKAINDLALCSYWCEESGLKPQSTISDIYNYTYSKTDLPTLYSSINGEEDFADSFALYVLIYKIGGSYEIHYNGQTYSLADHLASPRFAKKLKMLEDAYQQVVNYPTPAQSLIIE